MKKNLLLFIILVVLIGLAYVYQGPLQDWRAKTQKADNFLSKVNIDEINKIKIIKDAKETILAKEEKGWKISGTKDFFLEDDLASSMISDLRNLKEDDMKLVSNKEDKKIEFLTDENGGTKVALLSGDDVLAEFIIGKLSSDFINTYISQPNSSRTYSAKANFGVFTRNDWYNKTIFSSDKDKINKIRFQYPDRQFVVEKADPSANSGQAVWRGISPYKFSVSQEKIDAILDIMSGLNAVEIPEQNFSGTGLEKNNIIVQATGDGVDNTIIVGDNNDEDLYYAIRIGSDNIYLITKEQRDALDKNIRDLN